MTEDVVEMAEAAAAQPAGWHANPAGPGLRYWDGTEWTENYHPGHSGSEAGTPKETLWALSLGFGVAGGLPAAVGMPVLGFYFPLGLGGAGAALAIAAFTSGRGGSPWYAWVAIVASLLAIVSGADGLQQFNDSSSALSDLGN